MHALACICGFLCQIPWEIPLMQGEIPGTFPCTLSRHVCIASMICHLILETLHTRACIYNMCMLHCNCVMATLSIVRVFSVASVTALMLATGCWSASDTGNGPTTDAVQDTGKSD